MLLSMALGTVISAVVALGGAAPEAKAAFTEKIVFASNRTTGAGVNNPTGDYEIFRMNPDGTGVRQQTANAVADSYPVLSPDGTKIAYESYGVQTSNPEGDTEVYRMNALDGSGKKNLSNNGADVYDYEAVYSPGGGKIAYMSDGAQNSNPEGDVEVYTMNASDGTGQTNLSNNGTGVKDKFPDFSLDGTKIAYTSDGAQDSNPEGDGEVYRVNALDGTGNKNLTNNGAADNSPDWGVQAT